MRRTLPSILIPVVAVLAAVVVGVAPFSATPANGSARSTSTVRPVNNPIPPRFQWNHNFGYCGEVSFISAGLYYGQYLSQFDARTLASDGTPQYKASSQLLLGGNDQHAAAAMHLTYAEWTPGPGSTASSFLAWVKGEVLRGHPVAIGVYTNEHLFYGSTDPNAGDPEYDHIVPVTGVSSDYPLTLPAVYHASDRLTFSDNGLWTGTSNRPPPYYFSYPFGSFQATRQQANATAGSIYSLSDGTPDYGIAITGIVDQDHETMPVRVTTNVNDESPQIGPHSNRRPPAMPLVLTVTASGLTPGVAYHLYRYDSMISVPNAAFNQHGAAASQTWTFTPSTTSYTVTQTIESSDEVIFRAVPASAP